MNQTFNMEQASFTTSMLTDTVTTVNAMKMASKTIKQQFKQINIDGIDVIFKKYYYLIASLNLSKFSIAIPTPLITQNKGSSTTNEATPL